MHAFAALLDSLIYTRGRNAKLKLIAGLLAVGYNSLRQRELRRRQRQFFAIASAATAGMVITSGLAVFALISRATAQRETVIAARSPPPSAG